MPTYQHGSKGEDVERIQTRLKELGYYAGKIDGDFGPKTEAAVKAFQTSANLPTDGVVTQAVWARLLPRPPVNLTYSQPGLILQRGGAGATKEQLKDLQRDLRRLGYLKEGIDGNFGGETERAVKALQYDLLFNTGQGQGDSAAPVRLTDYNRGRVSGITGVVDQALAACIADLLNDGNCPTLPSARNPADENRRFLASVVALQTTDVPLPFLLAILKQESGFKHFCEPEPGDEDTYIVVGCDRNLQEGSPHKDYAITSRGYGAGQYTLFHHPPRAAEVTEIMLDPIKNVQKAMKELREKFDRFVNGPDSGAQADDRFAEFGKGPLRLCKYLQADPRYMRDCQRCAQDAGTCQIKVGDSWYQGSSGKYEPTPYHRETTYSGVPIRKNIGCDWPYAVRRYNGSGINSYHYQVKVLKHLLTLEDV